MSNNGAFSYLQNIIDLALNKINDSAVSSVIGAIGDIFGSIMLLYFTMEAFNIALGKKSFSFNEQFYKIIFFCIVTTFAFNAEGWLDVVIICIKEIKNLVINDTGVIGQLDNLVDTYNLAIKPIVDDAPYGAGWAINIIFWLAFFLMICSSLFVLLGSEIVFTLLIIFAPLAIFSLAFETTKGIFSNWITSLIGTLITILFSSAVLSLMAGVVITLTEQLTINGGDSPTFIIAGFTLMVGFFFFYFMKDVKSIAQSLSKVSIGHIGKAPKIPNLPKIK